MAAGFSLRPMQPGDLDEVMRVQAQCYPPSMQEPRAIVHSRMVAAGDTSLVAAGASGLCAYVFAYASTLGAVTQLDAMFALPDCPDTLYVHDLAVAPAALGKGLAKALVTRLWEVGRQRGLAHSALVSVQDSERFWTALGYAASAPAGQARAALASYPGRALYMVRALDAGH